MACANCIAVKDKSATYTKCKICNSWRKMNDKELAAAKKPYRFDGDGRATRDY